MILLLDRIWFDSNSTNVGNFHPFEVVGMIHRYISMADSILF